MYMSAVTIKQGEKIVASLSNITYEDRLTSTIEKVDFSKLRRQAQPEVPSPLIR